MTTRNWLIVITLTMLMIAAAIGMGRWAESVNPDGISPPVVPTDQSAAPSSGDTSDHSLAATAVTENTRDAFAFGSSLGLLAAALLYATFAIALLIKAKAAGRRPSQVTYWIAGLAGTGLALSYLVDDYFY